MVLLLLTCACNQGGNSVTETPEKKTDDGSTALIANPAAYYCTEIMGYTSQIVTADDGSQSGTCVMPDGEVCDEWDFFSGECGPEHSYCVKDGLSIETRSDGQDTYSQTYGVCINDDGQVQYKISDLLNIK